MIARIWRTHIDPARISEYEDFASHVSLPMFRAHHGFHGATMLRCREKALVITFWEDASAIDALENSALYQDTVQQIEATGLLRGLQSVETYDVLSCFGTKGGTP